MPIPYGSLRPRRTETPLDLRMRPEHWWDNPTWGLLAIPILWAIAKFIGVL